MIGQEPTLITASGEPGATPPAGEPVAAPQTAQETLCDPRAVLVTEPVESAQDVSEGDWLAAGGWSRPRRVECVDATGDGAVLHMADPDESRTNDHGIRRLDPSGWVARAPWRRYPNLRRLWDAAHGDS